MNLFFNFYTPMFKMRSKSLSGLEMNPVVGAVMIFVGIIAAGAITVMVMPLVNRGKDTKVMESLGAVKTAVSLFMVNTNGEAPCFDAAVVEGGTPATGDACEQAGAAYNYDQGSAADLDKDGTTGEAFTPYNILVPAYLDKIPTPSYAGEAFYYTKGSNDSTSNASAFAVSGLLHSDVADENVRRNVSILEAIDATTFGITGSTATACRSNDLVSNMGATATAVTELGGSKNYYAVPALSTTSFKAAGNCDIYSDGQIFAGAFSTTNSPIITINAN